jgi:hypothetical protein
MSMIKSKQSPHPKYRDVPEDEELGHLSRSQGVELDRQTIASKASTIKRLDLEDARNRDDRNSRKRDNNNDSTSEAILKNTFDSYNTGSDLKSGCKKISAFIVVATIILLIMAMEAVESTPASLVLILCLTSLAYAVTMTISLLEKGTGTTKMKRVAGFIEEGAQGFFRTQFFAIISMA